MKFKRLLSLVMIAAMLMTMVQMQVSAVDWDVSKSKTAENLDDNYMSEITISLPSAEETLTTDIVFVVDKSTSSGEMSTSEGIQMLERLNESLRDTGATVKVGIIQFDGTYHVMRELSPYDQADVEEKMAASIPDNEAVSGTNIEAGLIAAKNMLTEDTDVIDRRKHIVLISDGLTRLFTAENGETVQIIFNEQETDGISYFGDYTTWCLNNDFSDGQYEVPDYEDWMTYYNNVIKPQVVEDGDKYVVEFTGVSYINGKNGTKPDKYIPLDEVEKHAQSIDRAMYDAYNAYIELMKNYNCYAVFTGNSELGESFMEALNNGKTVDFDAIYDEIYYLLDAGSKIVDIIGAGKDNKNNEYNFDFVDDPEMLIVRVGNKSYKAVDITSEIKDSAYPSATKIYGFDDDDGDGNFNYCIYYFKDGSDNIADEHFIWVISVPVKNFEHTQLVYSVKLMNPQNEAGTYGVYDRDGSSNFDSLYTNKRATLYAIDSEGELVATEEFAKPTVSYTKEDESNPDEDDRPIIIPIDNELVITKTISGNLADENAEFTFMIELDRNVNGNYNGVVFVNGVAYVTLKGGESIVIEDLAPGTTYKVTELDSGEYEVTANNDTGTIPYLGSVNVEFNNHLQIDAPELNTTDHVGYLIGRAPMPPYNIYPTDNMTRAEVATVFFRLLTDEARAENWTQENNYSDVELDDWYNNAISTISAMGIMNGYPDGTFAPNASITRAEFITTAVRFFDYTAEYFEGTFIDVDGTEWFADYIAAGVELGMIEGYPDGSFLPNEAILRCEVAAIVNRTLGRVPDEDHLLDTDEMINWEDNLPGSWYYAHMQESSNSHDLEWVVEDGKLVEQWIAKFDERDWAALERAWSDAYSAPGAEVID